MATITLAANADWSTCNSGNPPAAGDTIYLNGKVLTLDSGSGDGGNEFTCVLIKACASNGTTMTAGTVVLGMATTIINANLTAGTSSAMMTVATETVTVNGTVTGGSSDNKYGISMSGGSVTVTTATGGTARPYTDGIRYAGGTLVVTTATGGRGDAVGVDGGSGSVTIGTANGSASFSGAYGLRLINTGPTVVVTTANGGAGNQAAGVYLSNGSVTLGTANGGSNTNSYGCYVGGGVTATITLAVGGSVAPGVGNLGTATIGTAKGGSAGVVGAYCYTGTMTVNGTDLTGTGYPVGVATGTLKVADGVKLRFSDADGVDKDFYGEDGQPAEADVRDGTSYGYSDYEGSMAAGSTPPPVFSRHVMRRV